MKYSINAGINEADLEAWLQRAYNKNGLYRGKYVDYTHAKIAPIVMCTVIFKNKILIAKRGYGLADAEGYWSTVNGFIDEMRPVKQIAQQEVRQELGLKVKAEQIFVATSYTLKNPKEKRTYIVFPCLVVLNKLPKIELDHEHTDYSWISRDQLEDYEILDDLSYTVDAALALKDKPA